MTLPDMLTPALVVDLAAFNANVAAASDLLHGSGKSLRPHFKTHRTPALALRQLVDGVGGLTCATVGEAEVLVGAGARDVLVANEVVTPRKLESLARLALGARISVAVDAAAPLEQLSRTASRLGAVVDVLIDIDIGLNRCGVRSVEQAISLAALASRAPGVRLAGIMGYEGRVRRAVPNRAEAIAAGYGKLRDYKVALEAEGHAIPVVSSSGTATLREALADPVITEIQAGTYALMEPDIENLGLPFGPAVHVLGTVISLHGNRTVLDVGRRSIGSDQGLPLSLHPGGEVVALNDEHAVMTWTGDPPNLGEHVRLRPTQNRTTFNLHDNVWIEQEGRIIDMWPVTARGRS